MVMTKSSKQVLSWWDFTGIDSLNNVTGLLQIMIQNLHILMKLLENCFRQEKYGLVVTCLSRPWSYFPSTMDFGFTICIKKETVMCNRKGENKMSHAYVNGALKAVCTFHFRLSSLETEKYLPPNLTVKKWRYKKRWDRPTQILSGCAEHGELCTPNRSNRIITSQRQGKYVYHIPSSTLFSLCNSLENSGWLDSNLIVNSLRHVWPRSKVISMHDVFNTRAKIMKLLPVFRDQKRIRSTSRQLSMLLTC